MAKETAEKAEKPAKVVKAKPDLTAEQKTELSRLTKIAKKNLDSGKWNANMSLEKAISLVKAHEARVAIAAAKPPKPAKAKKAKAEKAAPAEAEETEAEEADETGDEATD